MPVRTDAKARVQQALHAFAHDSLPAAAIGLWAALGYKSDKMLELPSAPLAFLQELEAALPDERKVEQNKAQVADWQAAHFLFQLSNDEIPSLAYGQTAISIGDNGYQRGMIESFVFLAVELTPKTHDDKEWTRSRLATITRELNRAFPMPAVVLFRYGGQISISVIDRRLNKRDQNRDVLDNRRISLIRDVDCEAPHRAHLEILNDLLFANLGDRYRPSNFRDLYDTWLTALSVQELNKRFYNELLHWFLWAQKTARFPKGAGPQDKPQTVAVIRLLTRLIFIWFIKEKGLVPDELFDSASLAQLLREPPLTVPNSSSYYKAILQNLFFATLNTEQGERAWKSDAKGLNSHYLIHSVYRYRSLFAAPERAFASFSSVPFLNGGLFECLDCEVTKRDIERNPVLEELALPEGKGRVLRVDGFSDRDANLLNVPNCLFFSQGDDVDLNEELHTTNRKREVRGLIPIFNRYKFTVEENTPIEEEVALDPELLGKVFENLLAYYNEDTSEQARKKSGSFYTPREVVDYIVDEALIGYFESRLRPNAAKRVSEVEEETKEAEETEEPEETEADLTDSLRRLMAFDNHAHDFAEAEVETLTAAIENLRALDPACGSGAFPMGMLQKLVHVLATLDPDNTRWKAQNRRPLERQWEQAKDISAPDLRETKTEEAEEALRKLDQAFSDKHYADYSRKLFLIEKCLFGVDIQPIAVQIAKLRVFISLIVSQKADLAQDNSNITALPNLETKLVAADSLIPIERPVQGRLRDTRIDQKEDELREANERHFAARTTRTKRKYRERITNLRDELAALLEEDQLLTKASAGQVVRWDPFDQNAHAEFFDPEWMFGLRGGFDVVMGNPPYVRQEKIQERKPLYKKIYECYTGMADLYVYFYERSIKLLKPGGVFAFITSNKWYRSNYGKELREWMQQNTTLRRIIDFGDAPIFEALAYPTIVIATRRVPPSLPALQESALALVWDNVPKEIQEDKTSFPKVFATEAFMLPQVGLKASGWHLEGASRRDLLKRINSVGKPLGGRGGEAMYNGLKTGLNAAFVLNDKEKEELVAIDRTSVNLLSPFLHGENIKRWRITFNSQWLIKIASSENQHHAWSGLPLDKAEQVFKELYPAIHARFSANSMRTRLTSRQDQGRYFWELRSCAYWPDFERPKIVFPDIARSPQFAYDEDSHYIGNTGYILVGAQPWILAVLNSSVTAWYYAQISPSIMSGYLRFTKQYVEQIRIPDVDAARQQILGVLVDILRQERRLSASSWERLVNSLVYELFFPQELHRADICLFREADRAGLTRLIGLQGDALTQQAEALASVIFKNDHPIFRMLFDLAGLEEVRTIEGRA